MSIYRKIFLVAFIFILFGLSLSTLLNIRTTRSILYEGAGKRALTIFRSLQEKCKYAITIIDAESMETYVDRKSLTNFVDDIERHESEVSEVLIVDGSGRVLSGMRHAPGEQAPPGRRELLQRVASEKALLQVQQDDRLILAGAIHVNNVLWGTAILEYSLLPIQKQVQGMTYNAVFMGVVFLLLSAVLALPLVATIVRPIRKLGDYASAIGEGRLDEPLPVRSRDEVGQLAGVFADTVGKLKQTMQTLERRMQELRESEEHARNSEKNYRELFENAVVGVFQSTISGTFLRVNPAMAAMLGYASPSELEASVTDINRDIFVRQTDRDELARILNKDARIVGFETEVYKKDGSVVAVSLSARTVRNATEHVRHIEGSLLDISARKEKEAAEREREAAKASNEAKSAFLAHMSHEIRTPMNAILGFSNLALKRSMPAQLRDYLLKINSATNALIAIINDILDFSKIEAGKLNIEPAAFDLQCVIDATMDALGLKASEKGLELLLDMDPRMPMHLVGDATRLRQILLNLGSNAVKFTQTGEIVIKIEVLEHTDSAIKLLFSVSDTGIGLSHEQLPLLFQSFSQADSSTTRKYGGTGLGLAICKNLVELMKGRIDVTSEYGKGSRFFFELPFALSESSPQPLQLPELPQGLQAVALDDNALSRELVCRYLEALGVRCRAASSQESLIAGVREAGSSCLVFLDMRMPGRDGLQVAQALRSAPDLAAVPCVLLCTAYDAQEGSLPKPGGGLVDGLLTKPLTPSGVCDFLQKFISKREHQAQPDEATCARVCQSFQGSRVLLVEDNQLNQQLAMEFLREEGVEITIADNGKQALQRLEERSFDLVFMDIEMPVMDGYEATSHIRRNEKYNGLPVVAMTAHAMNEERAKCLGSGMNDHIQKPFHKEELLRVLRQWLGTGAHSRHSQTGDAAERPPQTGDAAELPHASQEAATLPPAKEPLHQASAASEGPSIAPGMLAGIDVARGLAYANDSQRLYHKLLLQFREQGRNLVQDVRQAMDSSDQAALVRAAHTLKSTARLIGAKNVSDAATAMEAQAASPESWQESFERLQEALYEVLGSLDALEGAPSSGGSGSTLLPKAETKRIEPVLQSLKDCLENDVKNALKDAATLEELLQDSPVAQEALQLKNEVYDFEMRSAMKRLETLASRIGAELS